MGKGLPRSLEQAALRGQGRPNQPVITRRYPINHVVNVAAAGAGVGFGTVVVGDFPEGNIGLLQRVMNIAFTTADTDVIATWAGNVSVGSAPDADGSLAGAEVDIIASTAIGPATARAIATVRATNTTAVVLDNTDGSLELNLNMNINAADITDAQAAPITCTGFLELSFAVLGDD